MLMTFWPALSALTMLAWPVARSIFDLTRALLTRRARPPEVPEVALCFAAARAACVSTWLGEVRSKMLGATGGNLCMVKLNRNERTWTICTLTRTLHTRNVRKHLVRLTMRAWPVALSIFDAPFVKPVRRACARGWTFGQGASLAQLRM